MIRYPDTAPLPFSDWRDGFAFSGISWGYAAPPDGPRQGWLEGVATEGMRSNALRWGPHWEIHLALEPRPRTTIVTDTLFPCRSQMTQSYRSSCS